MNDSLNLIVGFWVEMIPKLKKPTEAELKLYSERIAGTADKDLPEDARMMLAAVSVLNGCLDHRESRPYIFRQSLIIFPTKREARRVAVTQENDYWTTKIRTAKRQARMPMKKGGM